MIDVVLRLIDRCIDLAKRRQEADKTTYLHFVTPAIQDFETVHKDYLASFKKYREMIAGSTGSYGFSHPVIDVIRTDSLFSGDLRSKLYVLHPLTKDPVIGRLVAAMEDYLKVAAIDPIEGYWTEADRAAELIRPGIANTIRTAFSNGLQRIFASLLDENSKQERALVTLDNIVARLQERYSIVSREHILVKQKLLSETRL